MWRAVLLILAQAHARCASRPPALKPKRLAKADPNDRGSPAARARPGRRAGPRGRRGAAAEALAGETAAELAETALTAAMGPSKFVVVMRFAFPPSSCPSCSVGYERLAARSARRRSSFNSFAAMGAQEAPPKRIRRSSTCRRLPCPPQHQRSRRRRPRSRARSNRRRRRRSARPRHFPQEGIAARPVGRVGDRRASL